MVSRISPLVYNETIVRTFYDKIISGLEMNEVSMALLASRSKYMTEGQKKAIRRGDSAVLARMVVKDDNADKYVSRLHRLSAESDYTLSYDGQYLPNNSFVIYAKVNPSDAIKAADNYIDDVLAAKNELINIYSQGLSKEKLASVMARIRKSDGLLYREIQCTTSRKRFIDIDVDTHVPDDLTADILKYLFTYTSQSYTDGQISVIPFIVRTRGGFHALVKSEDISSYNSFVASHYKDNKEIAKVIFTIDSYITYIKYVLDKNNLDTKEIKVNQEAMVPCPGTLQGGYQVIFA